MRLRCKFHNLSVFSCYAPAEASPEEEKESFYDQLDKALGSCPRSGINVIMGDFNAKICTEEVFRLTIREHCLHEETNKNGRLLINFAASKKLVVSSTLFPRKRHVSIRAHGVPAMTLR